jgi:hypothetical protein
VIIVLVAAVEAYEGRLYRTARDLTVLKAGRRPPGCSQEGRRNRPGSPSVTEPVGAPD